uniref:ORF1p n=1 Tax=Festuca pratensis amalgavirus 3 TaxID=2058874 RepID=A0A2Z6JJ34_9VIRU|nr:TPA_exp: ORF1p [Festuca pratensis amalgavirus 3]
MPRDPLLNLTANADVSEEQREKLAELLDGIIKAGLNLVNCTYEDMLGANITIDDVEKALKGLAPHYDNGVLADVWTVAANCGVVTSAQNFTLKSLFRFKVWITKDQGSTALRQAQQKAKLAKAGKDAFPADEMTLLRLWKAQQDDMQSFVKRERVPIDAKIASLRAKIVEQEELLEAKKGEEMMKYPLLSAYVAPDLSELRDLCWKVYLQICNSEGKEVFPKNEDNLRLVEEKYKELVLNRHLANFLRLPQNKNAMLNYGKLKIKKLEESKSKRELSTFRGFIAILDPQGAHVPPPEAEEGADGGNPDGGADPAVESDLDGASEQPSAAERSDDESDGRGTSRPRPTTSNRKLRDQLRAAAGKQAAEGTQRKKRAKTDKHTSRQK